MSYNKSFSLVELIVVITIIGVLSAIAIPAYKTYMIKSKITEALTVLKNLNNIVLLEFQKNNESLPATINLGNTTINQGVYNAYSSRYVNSIGYNSSEIIILTCVQIYNINIPGLVASSGTNSGTKTEICSCIDKTEFNIWCGVQTSVPNEYLPANCSQKTILPCFSANL